MMEWLVGWVATNAFGLLVKTILNEEFAKDLAKDYAKDFFKDRFNNVAAIFQKEPIQKAIAKALKEFLQLVEDELRFRRLSEEDIKKLAKPLKTFIYNKSVKEILGNAFDADCDDLDYQKLENTWKSLGLPDMPAKFNWQFVTDNYLRKCQQILSESEELRNILILQKLDVLQKHQQSSGNITPDFNLSQYQKAIRERYANLKLDSLNTTGCAYNELRLWRMFIPQNMRQVHQIVPELTKEQLRQLQASNQLDAEIELEKLESYKSVYVEQPLLSVLDIFQNKQTYKYIVILGDPGSGKSTLLQYQALDWVEQTLDKNEFHLPIPLLIELRTYMRNYDDGHSQNFLEFYHQSPGCLCHLDQRKLHEQLKAGNALVMFDGLDEVFDRRKREDVIIAIHRFTNEYPNVQIIVTSRVIGYKPQKLRDAGFIHFMLQDLEPKQIKNFIDRWHEETFHDSIDKERKRGRLQRAIEESKAIAELAGNPLLLTMMAILNRNQELPRDRATLYEQASRVLLHQWDVEAKLLTVDDIDPYMIDLKDKQAMLRQVAYQMQAAETGLAGNLISKDKLENTLFGYLQDIGVAQPRRIARLMIEQLRERNFILCYLGADYYAFVHRTFLEYFCASEFVWQFKETQTLSIEELKTEVFGKHWQDETWHEVLQLIAGMIEAKFTSQIVNYLINQDGEQKEFINLFLAAKCLSEMKSHLENLSICIKLLNYISINDNGRSSTWGLSGGKFTDSSSKINMHSNLTKAVAAVVTSWKHYTEIFSWLKDVAQTYIQSGSQDTGFVTATVIQKLAEGWKDDPDILPILKTCAQTNNPSVRYVAVYELGSGWKDQPGMFELLYNYAINDPFVYENQKYYPNPRIGALWAIIEQYSDHPLTLPLFRDRAENDPDERLREYAKKILAKLEGVDQEPIEDPGCLIGVVCR